MAVSAGSYVVGGEPTITTGTGAPTDNTLPIGSLYLRQDGGATSTLYVKTDSDLRRHGEKIASRGAKNSKKRAVVAVARKLAVLLHRLWVTGEVYDPLHNSQRPGGIAA
jgi:hypothetical protein